MKAKQIKVSFGDSVTVKKSRIPKRLMLWIQHKTSDGGFRRGGVFATKYKARQIAKALNEMADGEPECTCTVAPDFIGDDPDDMKIGTRCIDKNCPLHGRAEVNDD